MAATKVEVVTLRLADGTEVEAVRDSRLHDIYIARGARELTEKGNPRKVPDVNPMTRPSRADVGAGYGELQLAAETVAVPADANPDRNSD